MSEPLLLFRGEVQNKQSGEIIIDSLAGTLGSTRLEIAGTLTQAVLRVARLAARPRVHDALVAALEQELSLDDGVASTLISQLVEAGVLETEVATSTRLSLAGQSELADELRTRMAQEFWPAHLAGLEIAVLGRLGSASWRDELARAQRRPGPILTCSFEGSACWIGPVLSDSSAPCPLCLHARRVAARVEQESDITLSCPPQLGLVAALLRQVAESQTRAQLPRDRVLHVDGATSTWRSLLAQPGCPLCDPLPRASSATASSLSLAAEQHARAFQRALAVADSPDGKGEPSLAQREAFLDPVLGPLRLELYDTENAFLDLPLVLGSIRVADPHPHGPRRRELSSVMFGSGRSERRRRLVAYAEGIERYAAATEQPDLLARRYDELRPFALHPEQTVRFAPAQTAGRYRDQPADWSWACELHSARPRLLIHDVIAPSPRSEPGRFRYLDDPFTSGMAAHRTLELALARALLELVERDAFMLAWYLRLPLRRLDVARGESAAHGELHDTLLYLARGGIDIEFYDLRVDFSLPCVLAVATAQRDFGAWKAGGQILSACAGLTFVDALCHAARELLGHYTVFALVSPDGDKAIDPASGETRPWWPAFSSFLAPRADRPLAFLDDARSLAVPDSLPSSPARLYDELADRDVPIYVRKLGRAAVHSSGLTALRAIAPGLLRLTPTRESVNFGEPRIERVAARWGVSSQLSALAHPLA